MSKKYGPWRVEAVCRLGEVECANGFQIMDGDDVLVSMFEGNGWNKTQMKKILRLMAASPDLLEALEEAEVVMRRAQQLRTAVTQRAPALLDRLRQEPAREQQLGGDDDQNQDQIGDAVNRHRLFRL